MTDAPRPAPTDAYPGMPRWVKITLIALAAILVVAIVIGHVFASQRGPLSHVGG